MSLYLDTSCLLKLFFPEPETARTMDLVAVEPEVIVSSLTHLEALIQIQARTAARQLSRRSASGVRRRIDLILRSHPYELAPCPPETIELAARQVRSRRSVHCRTLDRLHLAAMEALGLRRLLTNDDTQARAARALGFDVTLPR